MANKVINNYHRFQFLKQPEITWFLSDEKGHQLAYLQANKVQQNITRLVGNETIEFVDEEEEIMFASNFYLSDEMIIHKRHVYNVIHLISEFGGFCLFFYNFFLFISMILNINEHRLISDMYHFKISEQDQEEHKDALRLR